MSVESDDPREFLELAHFAKDARALDGDGFRARHGEHFLVRRGALSPERRPMRPQRTLALKDLRELVPAGPAGPPAIPELVVFPVRVTGRSPFPRMITVGRTKNNDIILSDVGVSKFHAYFREEGGKLTPSRTPSRATARSPTARRCRPPSSASPSSCPWARR